MSKHNRLSDALLVNFERPVTFNFEGNSYQGYEGDSVASALHANDVKILSRSFKYHRARGIFSMTDQDGNTMIQLPNEGNRPADNCPISENLEVKGQHYIGSLKKDKLRPLNKFSRFLPVAFYYRAFYKWNMWDRLWHKFFRKLTGLGTINVQPDEKYFDKKFLHFDVVVVGGGISGLKTVLAIATSVSSKTKILLVDENPVLGGSLNYGRYEVGNFNNSDIRDSLVSKVSQIENITIMTNSTCNGVYSDNWLSIIKDNRLYKTRTKQLVLCTGTFEQPFVFNNNDLPGIMLSSAAQMLIKKYGVKPGKVAVVAVNNDEAYGTVLDLLDAGCEVKCVVDIREKTDSENSLVKEVKSKNIPIYFNHTIYSAGAKSEVLSYVDIHKIKAEGECDDKKVRVDCDLLCMSGGYMPRYQLACHLGARLGYNDSSYRFIVENVAKNVHLAGAVSSVTGNLEIESQAQVIAEKIRKLLSGGQLAENTTSPEVNTGAEGNIFVMPIFKHPKAKEFIDMDEDLQICDIINSVREGYQDIQLVKRFSTLGMGPSQGRFSAFAAAYLLANFQNNKKVGTIGVTTARPPYTAEKIGHMAGRSFFPKRLSSMHQKHLALNAQPLLAGAWIRPAFYGDKNSMIECVGNEAVNVRTNVGLVDISTLGGLEVRGPEAAEFINRMYTWTYDKVGVGKVRYALLTNEAGIVIDDGVACRLSNEHYYITATTGGVDNVYMQFQKWNARLRMDVDIANVTSAWCGVNIAGPNSRKVLQKVCDEIDLSPEGFPYLAVRQAKVAGIDARIIRIGFVGELGYEIHVPQLCGEKLWESLMEAGKEFDIKPFGIETQRMLRLEKGHIIVSQDTDSMTYPEEVSMSWAVSKKKPFFVGAKSIEIVAKNKPIRKLIGFEILSESLVAKENHLCFKENNKLIGRVTSCGHSKFLQKTIGMAYVDPDCSEVGFEFKIRCDDGKYATSKVVSLPFYDPEGKRQEM